MARTVQQFLQRLVDAKALSTTDAAMFATALTAEQRGSDAKAFARKLVELKRISEAQAAAALKEEPAKTAAPPDDDLSLMLGIQPLRGIGGRATASDSSSSVTAVNTAATNDADDGLSAMLGIRPLRSLNASGSSPSVPAAPPPEPQTGSNTRLWIIVGAIVVAILAVAAWVVVKNR